MCAESPRYSQRTPPLRVPYQFHKYALKCRQDWCTLASNRSVSATHLSTEPWRSALTITGPVPGTFISRMQLWSCRASALISLKSPSMEARVALSATVPDFLTTAGVFKWIVIVTKHSRNTAVP
jgi:hypothetical protein